MKILVSSKSLYNFIRNHSGLSSFKLGKSCIEFKDKNPIGGLVILRCETPYSDRHKDYYIKEHEYVSKQWNKIHDFLETLPEQPIVVEFDVHGEGYIEISQCIVRF